VTTVIDSLVSVVVVVFVVYGNCEVDVIVLDTDTVPNHRYGAFWKVHISFTYWNGGLLPTSSTVCYKIEKKLLDILMVIFVGTQKV